MQSAFHLMPEILFPYHLGGHTIIRHTGKYKYPLEHKNDLIMLYDYFIFLYKNIYYQFLRFST